MIIIIVVQIPIAVQWRWLFNVYHGMLTFGNVYVNVNILNVRAVIECYECLKHVLNIMVVADTEKKLLLPRTTMGFISKSFFLSYFEKNVSCFHDSAFRITEPNLSSPIHFIVLRFPGFGIIKGYFMSLYSLLTDLYSL